MRAGGGAAVAVWTAFDPDEDVNATEFMRTISPTGALGPIVALDGLNVGHNRRALRAADGEAAADDV